MAAANSELTDLLECPICMEFMYPPIFQCANGHTVCEKCKPSMRNSCPHCRKELGDIRALVLEKMALVLHFPCKYSSKGCSQVLKYDAKQKHEVECRHRPFSCPYPGTARCVFSSDIQTLVGHLKSDHGCDVKPDYEINTVFVHNRPSSNDNTTFAVTVHSCLSENFCLHFEAFRAPTDLVYITYLTFMGDDMAAANFCYNLEVGNEECKLTWQGNPRSMRDTGQKIRDSYEGLVIHSGMARKFAETSNGEQLSLRVKGFIWSRSW